MPFKIPKNNSLLWQGVISFDNSFLESQGLYDKATGQVDQQAIKNVIRDAMPKMIEKEGLSESAFWWGNIHLNTDKIKAKKVFDGLSHYAKQLGVPMELDHTNSLGNAKGAFSPAEQRILLNSKNTPGEQIATAIHELAHASLHNPKFIKGSQLLLTSTKEFEAEMSSYLVSKHFGLDTSKEAISYMANWTNNLKKLDDKELQNAMKRVHKTVSTIVTSVEKKALPIKSPNLKQKKSVNFSQPLKRGIKL